MASSEVLSQAGIATSEQLVKALKSAQDTTLSGTTKIQIAKAAWSDSSFYVPKKPELISEWLLDYIAKSSADSKGKSKAKGKTHYEVQPECWQLLDQIITSQLVSLTTSRSAKQQWTNNLASSNSIVAIATSLAKSLASESHLNSNSALTIPASSVLKVLLPSSCSRSASANIETVAEAIRVWLEAIPKLDQVTGWHAAAIILDGLVEPWATALEFSINNSKKNSKFFLSNSFPAYLGCLKTVQQGGSSETQLRLVKAMHQIGSRSLFTDEVLLSFVGDKADASIHPTKIETGERADEKLMSKLQSLAEGDDKETAQAALSGLPTLLHLLTQRLRQEVTKFLTPAVSTSYSAMSVIASEQAHQATIRSIILAKFLRPISPLIRKQLGKTRSDLLVQIKQLDLYVPASEESQGWTDLFQGLLDDTISEGAKRADSLDSLRTLWSLEQSIVEPRLTEILSHVATVQVTKPSWNAAENFDETAQSALSFLKVVTSSFSRARDVRNLVTHVFDACLLEPIEAVETGVLFSTAFATEMGKAIADFLNPMQLESLLVQLRERLAKQVSGWSASKKRVSEKASRGAEEAGSEQGLILSLQILTVVLLYVPIAQPVRGEAVAIAESIHNQILLPCIDAGLEKPASLESSRTLAAALRTRASLLSGRWRVDPEEPIRLDGSAQVEDLPCLEVTIDERKDQLLGLFSSHDTRDEASAEAVLEVVRTLLARAERDHAVLGAESTYTALLSDESSLLVAAMVSSIKAAADRKVPCQAWDGKVVGLSRDTGLSCALWLLSVTRFAELIDQLGSNKFLSNLSQVLIQTLVVDTSSIAAISRSAARDAHFLELPRWRTAILLTATEITQGLSTSTRPILADVGTFKGKVDEQALEALCATEQFPVEWIARSNRDVLLDRCLALDATLVHSKNQDLVKWITLRKLIGGLMLSRGAVPDLASERTTASLALLTLTDTKQDVSLERITLATFQVGVKNLVQQSHQEPQALDKLQRLYRLVPRDTNLGARAVQIMLVAFAQLKHTETVANAESIETSLVAARTSLASDDLESLVLHLKQARLELALLGSSTDMTPHVFELLQPVCVAVANKDTDERVKLRICAEMLMCLSVCSAAVKAAFAFASFSASLGEERLVDSLAPVLIRKVTQLSVGEYDATLTSLLESITVLPLGLQDQQSLIATAALLLCKGPESSSRIARRHLTQLLGQLASQSTLDGSAAISTLCSCKTNLLRSTDVGLILHHFSAIASGANFAQIVTCLNALVRLRQDLLLPFLPHLASLLCKICGLLESVADARLFARLLSGLTIKTSTGESLARPFSKHAVYVIVAYLRLLTAPDLIISSEARTEVQPGLLALCGIIGKYERDAAMVGSLDAAGKTLFKRLWKEYEKQRYRGQ